MIPLDAIRILAQAASETIRTEYELQRNLCSEEKLMTHEDRAAVVIEELNTYHKLDPVAWLATVFREFEREIRDERNTQPLAAAAEIPE